MYRDSNGEPFHTSVIPGEAVEIRVPYSEVCCHMRVAGTTMWVVLRADAPRADAVYTGARETAQLYDASGRAFSFPILASEVGILHVPGGYLALNPFCCPPVRDDGQ